MFRPKPFGALWLAVTGPGSALAEPKVRRLLGLTAAIVAVAAVFYRVVEGWTWLDAVFFAVVTISTVGYGEMVPQTVPGRIFTMVYISAGIGIFVAAAGAVAENLIRRTKLGDKQRQTDDPH